MSSRFRGSPSSVSRAEIRKAFVAFSYALLPIGLAAWIAFSLSFVFANLSYLWPALSDPMGWGWNLFGTARVGWTPYLSQIVPALQAGALLGGLIWASVIARRIAAETSSGYEAEKRKQALSVIAFCFVVTVVLLGLLVG